MQTSDEFKVVDVSKVAWAKSEGKPWWPVYVCDPSNLRSELHFLGSGHRRMLRKAQAEPNEYFLAFYFGSYLFRLHSRNDGTLQPWMCPSYYELLHGHSLFKRGPLKDAFREAIREVKEFIATKAESRVLPRMVPSDIDLSLEPPTPLASQKIRVEANPNAIVIDLDEEDGAPQRCFSPTAQRSEELPYNSLAWCYVVGKTWWPVYVCNPDDMLALAKSVDKRARLGKMVTTYTTEIQIAQSHKATQRLLYFFGTHNIRLHDTEDVASSTGIKLWECDEHARFLADNTTTRKDEEFARAMKELKDYLSMDPNRSFPPYSSFKSPPSSAESPQDLPSSEVPVTSESQQLTSWSSSDNATTPKENILSKTDEPFLTMLKKKLPEGLTKEIVSNLASSHIPPFPLQRENASLNMSNVADPNVCNLHGSTHSKAPRDDTTIPKASPYQDISRNNKRQRLSTETPIKMEANLSASSVAVEWLQDCVSWALLNGELWWPVRVFGSILDVEKLRNPGVDQSTTTEPRSNDRQAYYFGRKCFGNIYLQDLKPWNGPDHNSLIYEQPVLEQKSKVFVSEFVDAVAEAGDFVTVYASLTERATTKSPTSQLNLSPAETSTQDEPPRKQKMIHEPFRENGVANLPTPTESLASYQKNLVPEFVMLRSVMRAVVPAWKVAIATSTIENFTEFSKSLQIVMGRLYTIMRVIVDSPGLISSPLVFVSTHHSITLCLWTVILSVALRNLSPASSNDVHLMQKCLRCFLLSVDGILKPPLHSFVIQQCSQFANEVLLFARRCLAPEVEKTREWMHHFFMMYLSPPLTFEYCRPILPDVNNHVLRSLPLKILRELSKIDALRRDFETPRVAPAVAIQPVATTENDNVSQSTTPNGSVTTTVSFYEDALGLHLGEVKNWLCVLGMVESAPEQTQRIVQSGAVARGDYIVEVNYKPVSELGGLRGLSSIISSSARPIVITFRRPASRRNTATEKNLSANVIFATSNAHDISSASATHSTSILELRDQLTTFENPSIVQTLDDLNPSAIELATPTVMNLVEGSSIAPQEPSIVESSDPSHPLVQSEMRFRQRQDPRLNTNVRSVQNHSLQQRITHADQYFQPNILTTPSSVANEPSWYHERGYDPLQHQFPALPTHNVTYDQGPVDRATQFYNSVNMHAVPAPNNLGPPNYLNYPPPPVVYLAVPIGHPWYNSVLQRSMASYYPPQLGLPHQQNNVRNRINFAP